MSIISLPMSGDLARISPASYLSSARFWREHFELAAVLVGGGTVLAGLLWTCGAPGEGADQGVSTVLNIVFMLLLAGGAAWGGRAAVLAMADVGVNRAIALSVDGAAEGRLRRVRAGEAHEVQDLWTLLPENISHPVPGMLRMLQQICKEAEGRRFDAAAVVVQPFREESAGQLAELERAQRFCLRLGILGTFVGLLLALGGLPQGLSQIGGGLEAAATSNEALMKGLEAEKAAFARLSSDLLSSLGLAFGTSAVGITAAVWVAALGEALRRRQDLYFKEMEGCALTVLLLASRSLQRDTLLAGLEQAGAAMKTLEMQLYDGTQKIQEGLAGVAERVEAQTRRIGEGLSDLAVAKKDFDGFLSRLGEGQQAFLSDLRALYDVASMKRLFEGVSGAVERAGEEVAGEVEEMEGRLESLDGAIGAVRGELGTLSGEVERRVQRIEGALGRIELRLTEVAERPAAGTIASSGAVSTAVPSVPRGVTVLALATGLVSAIAGVQLSEAISASPSGCGLVLVILGVGAVMIFRAVRS